MQACPRAHFAPGITVLLGFLGVIRLWKDCFSGFCNTASSFLHCKFPYVQIVVSERCYLPKDFFLCDGIYIPNPFSCPVSSETLLNCRVQRS